MQINHNNFFQPGDAVVDQLTGRAADMREKAAGLIRDAEEHERVAAKMREDEAVLQQNIQRLDAAVAVLTGKVAAAPTPDHAAIKRGVRRVAKQVYRATKKAQKDRAADKPAKAPVPTTTLDYITRALRAHGPLTVKVLTDQMRKAGWESTSKTPDQVVRTALEQAESTVGIRRTKRNGAVTYRLEAAHV